jgi:hypothetical protein
MCMYEQLWFQTHRCGGNVETVMPMLQTVVGKLKEPGKPEHGTIMPKLLVTDKPKDMSHE